jgi:hypothetical protein
VKHTGLPPTNRSACLYLRGSTVENNMNGSPPRACRTSERKVVAKLWTVKHYAAMASVVVLTTIILIGLGTRQFVGYDSFWHVFIAKQDSWANFWREVIDNAHPPLYYLLLGIDIKLLGESLIAYRAISIGSILVSTLLIARIVATITSKPGMAILAGAAFGLSSNAVEIGLEVRAYALCLTLLLAAFSTYIDWLGTKPARLHAWKRALLAGTMTTAVLTNYSAFFFIAAAVSAPLVLFCCHRRWRIRLTLEARQYRYASVLMFGVPLLAVTASYFIHVRQWANRLNHVPSFIYDPGCESVPAFIARTTHDLVLLSFPKAGTYAVVTMVAALVLFATAVWLVLRRDVRGRLIIIPFIILSVMVCLNLLAALAGRYPYGGTLRHEFFLFPFAIVALFVMIESVRRKVPFPWSSQRFWLGTISLGLTFSCYLWISTYPVVSKALMQTQMDKFRAAIKTPPAVLVDQFNFIILFGHYHDWDWHLERKGSKGRLRQIWDVSKAGQHFRVCRSRQWQLDFSQPAAFADVAECISQGDRVAVFRPQQDGFLPTWKTDATPQLAYELGQEMGLYPEVVLVEGNDVYLSFRPFDGHGSGQRISVIDATYGGNCSAVAGTETSLLRSSCDGRHVCTFPVDARVIGDPAPGCKKDFRVIWTCGEDRSPRQMSIAPEAGFGSVAFLTCGP